MGPLPDDWWSTEDVATYLSVNASTVRAYVARQQMPQPDRHIGRMQLWRPETIQEWQQGRPRPVKGPQSSAGS
jgi:predicted DNA-binding transcriptional regulator AlpA